MIQVGSASSTTRSMSPPLPRLCCAAAARYSVMVGAGRRSAIRQAAGHGEHVTPETLRAEVATLHGEIGSLRADIYRAMLLQAGAIVGAVVAILRLFG